MLGGKINLKSGRVGTTEVPFPFLQLCFDFKKTKNEKLKKKVLL